MSIPMRQASIKYKIPNDEVYTDYVGEIIYEDEYQVGAVDCYEP